MGLKGNKNLLSECFEAIIGRTARGEEGLPLTNGGAIHYETLPLDADQDESHRNCLTKLRKYFSAVKWEIVRGMIFGLWAGAVFTFLALPAKTGQVLSLTHAEQMKVGWGIARAGITGVINTFFNMLMYMKTNLMPQPRSYYREMVKNNVGYGYMGIAALMYVAIGWFAFALTVAGNLPPFVALMSFYSGVLGVVLAVSYLVLSSTLELGSIHTLMHKCIGSPIGFMQEKMGIEGDFKKVRELNDLTEKAITQAIREQGGTKLKTLATGMLAHVGEETAVTLDQRIFALKRYINSDESLTLERSMGGKIFDVILFILKLLGTLGFLTMFMYAMHEGLTTKLPSLFEGTGVFGDAVLELLLVNMYRRAGEVIQLALVMLFLLPGASLVGECAFVEFDRTRQAYNEKFNAAHGHKHLLIRLAYHLGHLLVLMLTAFSTAGALAAGTESYEQAKECLASEETCNELIAQLNVHAATIMDDTKLDPAVFEEAPAMAGVTLFLGAYLANLLGVYGQLTKNMDAPASNRRTGIELAKEALEYAKTSNIFDTLSGKTATSVSPEFVTAFKKLQAAETDWNPNGVEIVYNDAFQST